MNKPAVPSTIAALPGGCPDLTPLFRAVALLRAAHQCIDDLSMTLGQFPGGEKPQSWLDHLDYDITEAWDAATDSIADIVLHFTPGLSDIPADNS